MHADFNWHGKLRLYRQTNILIYLNSNLKKSWGGDLQLAKKFINTAFKRIYPNINTMVIFTTDENSMHGHPDELHCPKNKSRKSIALYFYSPIKPSSGFFMGKRGSTDYRKLDGSRIQHELTRKKIKDKPKYFYNWTTSKVDLISNFFD